MSASQDLVVRFKFSNEDYDLLDDFEEHLENAVTFRSIGTYEGYELDEQSGSEGEFYMTTTNPDLLVKTIKPLFQEARFLQTVKVMLQTGTEEGNVQPIQEYQF